MNLDTLVVALIVEGTLILVCLLMLVLLRIRLTARARAIEAGVRLLEPTLHGWLVQNDDVQQIVVLLRHLAPDVAFHSTARLATPYLTFERQQTLAPLLRNEAWVRKMLRHG